MTTLSRRRNRSVNDLQREIDRMFGRFFPSLEQDDESPSSQAVWAPRTDLVETDDSYRLQLDVPGMSKDELNINVKDNQLTVSGERKSERTEESEEYVRVERSFGQFYRSFSLPRTVNANDIRASYDSGVLTISVPKSEEEKARKIEIQ